MNLPFDVPQFFAVFASYNAAVWPAQLVLTGLALAAIVLALRSRAWSDRATSGILGLLWIWMGLIYFVGFLRTINPAATLFGALFVLEGVALLTWGGFRRGTRFGFERTTRGALGAALLAFALVAYPVLGYAIGHRYPATPTFGVPCPTTIFTLGLLLWTEPPVPRALLVVPLLWSAMGASAALQLGVWEDLGLVAAGLLTAFVTFVPRRATAARLHA